MFSFLLSVLLQLTSQRTTVCSISCPKMIALSTNDISDDLCELRSSSTNISRSISLKLEFMFTSDGSWKPLHLGRFLSRGIRRTPLRVSALKSLNGKSPKAFVGCHTFDKRHLTAKEILGQRIESTHFNFMIYYRYWIPNLVSRSSLFRLFMFFAKIHRGSILYDSITSLHLIHLPISTQACKRNFTNEPK